MTSNLYFNNHAFHGEQNLIEDLIVESIKIYGLDVQYLPRTIVAEDSFFGEDPLSKFTDSYEMEMYIKNVEGFEGEGDFLSRFGKVPHILRTQQCHGDKNIHEVLLRRLYGLA